MKVKNTIFKIFLTVLIFSLFIPAAYAGVTFSSVSYDDTTADVGTSRSVSVTMRTSSSTESVTATDITLSSSPSGLTTISSPEKPFTITYSGVTKTFTIRSDTASSYSFSITVVDSGGSSYSSSTDLGTKTLEYVNPSSLMLTSVEYPSGSYNKDTTANKFGVVVRIQNSLVSSQTRNLTLYFDTSGFTVSGDPQSASVTLSSGQTEKIWNVTVGSSVSDGTHYAYVRLGDNTAAATYSFTVTSTTTATTTAASSGGGSTGTTNTTVAVSETKTIPNISAGSIGTTTLNKSDTLKIQEIKIEAKNAVSNVQITVKESSLPSGASAVIASDKGTVYKYLEIAKSNIQDADINKVKIKFKVEKSWLTANNIDSTSVALSRYSNNNWNKLTTTKLSEDSTYVYYEAESPGLSVFAVYGEKLISATTTIPAATTVPPTTTTVPILPPIIPGMQTEWIIVVIVTILVVIFLVWKFFISGKKSQSES